MIRQLSHYQTIRFDIILLPRRCSNVKNTRSWYGSAVINLPIVNFQSIHYSVPEGNSIRHFHCRLVNQTGINKPYSLSLSEFLAHFPAIRFILATFGDIWRPCVCVVSDPACLLVLTLSQQFILIYLILFFKTMDPHSLENSLYDDRELY